jgi:S1-C subfamily serine protease
MAMKRRISITVLLAATAMLASSLAVAAEPADRAATEKDLAAARTRLDEAAKEVADLSRQLYGDDEQHAMRMMHGRGPQGAMLGVNIGGEQTRDDGVQVLGVSPSGPAQAAGLKAGDVIVSVDGRPLKKTADASSARQLVDYMRGVKPGQTVKVDYLRDGKRMTASLVATQAMPPMAMLMRERMMLPPGMEGMMPGMMDFMGFGHAFGALELASVTPKLGQYFGTDKGLLVVRAPTEGDFRLEDGDVILAIDGRVPENPGHAYRILGSYQPGEKVTFDVLRSRKRMTVEATMPKAGEFGPPHARPLQPRLPPPAPVPPPSRPAESA